MLVRFRFSKNNKSCNIQAKNFVLNLKFFQILFFSFCFQKTICFNRCLFAKRKKLFLNVNIRFIFIHSKNFITNEYSLKKKNFELSLEFFFDGSSSLIKLQSIYLQRDSIFDQC